MTAESRWGWATRDVYYTRRLPAMFQGAGSGHLRSLAPLRTMTPRRPSARFAGSADGEASFIAVIESSIHA